MTELYGMTSAERKEARRKAERDAARAELIIDIVMLIATISLVAYFKYFA